jgi:membrane protease YdiL (CAAX protease family)
MNSIPTWLSFFLFTILLSIPFYLQLRQSAGDKKRFERVFRRLLLIPGVVGIGFRIIERRAFDDLINVTNRPWLLVGVILLPILMELLVILASKIFTLADIDGRVLNFSGGTVNISPSVQLALGNKPQSVLRFIANIVYTVFLGTLAFVVFTLFEEMGWRGYLQGELIDAFGITWGTFIGGILWGIWYIPLVLQGYQFPEYRRLGAFLFMPMFTIALSMMNGWLYVLAGNIWVPALLNAATKITTPMGIEALGEAGYSRRIRLVWAWVWLVVAGLGLALWQSGS